MLDENSDIIDSDALAFIERERKPLEWPKSSLYYLGRNLKLLFRSVSSYSFTILLLALLISLFALENRKVAFENLLRLGGNFPKSYTVLLATTSLLYGLSICTMTLVVNKLIMLASRQQEDAPSSRLLQLKNDFMSDLKNYVFNFIIIFCLFHVISYGITRFEQSAVNSGYLGGDTSTMDVAINWAVKNILMLALMPLVLFFGYAALFVSFRDNIGSMDALVKVYQLVNNHLKKIWLSSLMILLLLGLGNLLVDFLSRALFIILPFNEFGYFVATIILKFSYTVLLVSAQVLMIFLFLQLENHPEEVDTTISAE